MIKMVVAVAEQDLEVGGRIERLFAHVQLVVGPEVAAQSCNRSRMGKPRPLIA